MEIFVFLVSVDVAFKRFTFLSPSPYSLSLQDEPRHPRMQRLINDLRSSAKIGMQVLPNKRILLLCKMSVRIHLHVIVTAIQPEERGQRHAS